MSDPIDHSEYVTPTRRPGRSASTWPLARAAFVQAVALWIVFYLLDHGELSVLGTFVAAVAAGWAINATLAMYVELQRAGGRRP